MGPDHSRDACHLPGLIRRPRPARFDARSRGPCSLACLGDPNESRQRDGRRSGGHESLAHPLIPPGKTDTSRRVRHGSPSSREGVLRLPFGDQSVYISAMNHPTPVQLPRGRPRSFDTGAAVERAMGVFWSRGYHATALPDLLRATRLSRGSLYAAFGDKHSLFLRALDRYIADALTRMDFELDPRKSRSTACGLTLPATSSAPAAPAAARMPAGGHGHGTGGP